MEEKKKTKTSEEDYITLEFNKLSLPWAIFLSVLVLTAGISAAVYFGIKNQAPAPTGTTTIAEEVIPTEEPFAVPGEAEFAALDKATKELPLLGGSYDAPIVVIEFGEYSCGYCQKYHKEAFPNVNSEYIKKGKIQMFYADVLRAEDYLYLQKYAICMHDVYGNNAYNQLNNAIYNNFTAFALNEDSIKDYISKTMKKDINKIEKCYSSALPTNAVARNVSLAQSVSTQQISTPTFFVGLRVDGKIVAGEGTYAGVGTIEQVAEKYLAQVE